MVQVTNLARGPRTVQEKTDAGVVTRTLSPGESADLELVNPEDPVLLGMVEARELDVGGARTRRAIEGDHEKVTGQLGDLEKQFVELKKKQAELQAQLDAPRFANDPTFKANRAAAMIAGHTPGYSDGVLPGAEPGPETEETLKKLGVDPKEAAEADPRQGGVDNVRRRPVATAPASAAQPAHHSDRGGPAQSERPSDKGAPSRR